MRHTLTATVIALATSIGAVACGDDDPGTTDTADTVGDATDVADTTQDTTTSTTPTDASGDADATPTGAVVINEVYTTGSDDWIELYNPGGATVDVGGLILSDDDPEHLYALPAGTTVAAGAYLVVTRGPGGFDFGLGDADAVLLLDGDDLVDSTTWTEGDVPAGFSWGRFPNGSGAFSTRFVPTPGAANPANVEVVCDNGTIEPTELCDGDDLAGVTCGDLGFGGGTLACGDECDAYDTTSCQQLGARLVINEVTSQGDDQIELFNGTGAAIDLTGYTVTDDAAQVYAFSTGTIGAGDYFVLVKGVHHDFGLGGDDAVTLRDDLGALVDEADWDEGEALVSYCRVPNGVGGFQTCATQTFGASND